MKKSTINFLTNIKNHSLLKKEILEQQFYQSSLKIVKILYKEGFIQSFKISEKNFLDKKVTIILRFFFNKPLINKILFFSKSSNKTFIKYKQLAKICSKTKVLILSTSKGILTAEECLKKKIGGLILFIIK